ncbi:MAG TPA: hypothetical protein P5026_03155 [Kiritimatiellia bacterium]|nr:hypothetical protein [Kiritimatiellia bacterium]HRU70215.1 hypothetical protein [Kiritimatiellia bacterium]
MKRLNRNTVWDRVRGFQPACVIIAAAELDVLTMLNARPMGAATLARKIKAMSGP